MQEGLILSSFKFLSCQNHFIGTLNKAITLQQRPIKALNHCTCGIFKLNNAFIYLHFLQNLIDTKQVMVFFSVIYQKTCWLENYTDLFVLHGLPFPGVATTRSHDQTLLWGITLNSVIVWLTEFSPSGTKGQNKLHWILHLAPWVKFILAFRCSFIFFCAFRSFTSTQPSEPCFQFAHMWEVILRPYLILSSLKSEQHALEQAGF